MKTDRDKEWLLHECKLQSELEWSKLTDICIHTKEGHFTLHLMNVYWMMISLKNSTSSTPSLLFQDQIIPNIQNCLFPLNYGLHQHDEVSQMSWYNVLVENIQNLKVIKLICLDSCCYKVNLLLINFLHLARVQAKSISGDGSIL